MPADLRDLLERAAGSPAEIPEFDDLKRRSRRIRRGRILGQGLVGIVLIALVLFAVAYVPSLLRVDRQPPKTAAQPEATPQLFQPPTYREGDSEVLPLTFPDGTSLELVYPTELALGQLGLRPYVTAGVMTSEGLCGGGLITYHDDQWFRGDSTPIATFAGATGPVELWTVPDDYPTARYLIFRFGSWTLGVPDGAGCEATAELRETWASQLKGKETENGFLILEASQPIRVVRDGAQAPTLLFGDGPDLEIVLQDCASFGADDEVDGKPVFRSADQFSWCLPEVSLVVHVFGSENFAESLFQSLHVRNVSSKSDSA